MGKQDKKVDAYIARSGEFAKPILEHIRQLVHEVVPDVEESIKWGFPHFNYRGILASMAAFKSHCAFGFWKGAIMSDPHKVMSVVGKTSMGSFNKITKLEELPSDKILKQYLKEAVKLNDEDVKVSARPITRAARPLKAPPDLITALKKKKAALANFNAFTNSQKKEYVQWITEAKTDETRARRIKTSVDWISEGKIKDWKYVKK